MSDERFSAIEKHSSKKFEAGIADECVRPSAENIFLLRNFFFTLLNDYPVKQSYCLLFPESGPSHIHLKR